MQEETTNMSGNCGKKYKCMLTTAVIVLLGASTAYLFMQYNNQKTVIVNQGSYIAELKSTLTSQATEDNNFKSYPDILFDNSLLSFRHVLSGIEDKMFKLWNKEFADQGEVSYYSHIGTRISENEYVITVALPGFAKESISIELSGNKLLISTVIDQLHNNNEATNNADTEAQDNKKKNNGFKQAIKIPNDIDRDNIKTKLNNGLLTITLPRVHDKANLESKKILID